MTKYGYEMVDPNTGEVSFVETVIDIGPLKAYNEWVIENKLRPPRFEPEDYARYLEGVKRQERIDKAVEFINGYDFIELWPLEVVMRIRSILTDEE